MKISILIPCYNEEKSIGHVLNQLQQIKLPIRSEIIVVDDGSTDASPHIVKQIQQAKLIQHKVNCGKGAAIKSGVEQASGDLIVIQDADLEYNPVNIPTLITPLLKGEADMVLGSRFKGRMERMNYSHFIANKALSFTASRFIGKSITDIMTGYKAFTKKGFQGINLSSKSFEVEVELVARFASKGLKIIEVPIDYKRRPYGKAKINWKHGFKCLCAILRYSRREHFHSFSLCSATYLNCR